DHIACHSARAIWIPTFAARPILLSAPSAPPRFILIPPFAAPRFFALKHHLLSPKLTPTKHGKLWNDLFLRLTREPPVHEPFFSTMPAPSAPSPSASSPSISPSPAGWSTIPRKSGPARPV